MAPVTFPFKKGSEDKVSFEWILDTTNPEHVGCYFNPAQKDAFKDLLCSILKVVIDD